MCLNADTLLAGWIKVVLPAQAGVPEVGGTILVDSPWGDLAG